MNETPRTLKERGHDVTICEPVTLLKPEALALKSRVMISEFAFIHAGLGTHIGNFVHVASHVSIGGGGYCVLEDFVGVASGARLVTGTDLVDGSGLPGPTVPAECRSFVRSYVHCGKHAFLGTNCVVLPGLTVGEGAVVAAGSVVTKDLEPWGVYAGVPARRVKDRPRGKIAELEAKAYAATGLAPSSFHSVVELMKAGKK
jgi:acetyltransferase-like isoleucine patch superfamily enzyme